MVINTKSALLSVTPAVNPLRVAEVMSLGYIFNVL